MAKLIYFATTSLDGYTADEQGGFEWTAPDEEVHAFVNDRLRPIGTYLFGRRMYETMRVWETMPLDGESAGMNDFARIWHAADKVVFSASLDAVTTANTRLERSFSTSAVARLKTEATRDLDIGGPRLASNAIRAGLVDEYHRFIVPIVVGGGLPYFPRGVHLDLELADEHRFANGTVYLKYGVVAR